MDEIKELLDTEISNELSDLGDLERGSETYKVTVDGITKLMDKRIEMEKLERDTQAKDKDREIESKKAEGDLTDKAKSREIDEKKLAQIANEKNDQLFKNGIAIAGIVIPSMITIWGTFKTLKFEETGTVTTIMGRGFVNKLIPKK
jgi:hypothetical protein